MRIRRPRSARSGRKSRNWSAICIRLFGRAGRPDAPVQRLTPGGGLAAHEIRAANGAPRGHTIAKHVDKSDDYLAHRLATEKKLERASTFANREVAEEAVSATLQSNSMVVRLVAVGHQIAT